MRRVGLALALVIAAGAARAAAHDRSPGVLALEEASPGRFLVAWTAPVDTRSTALDDARPRFPAHCGEAEGVLDCGARGLEGEVEIAGLEGTGARVVIVVRWLDGRSIERMATGDAPRVSLGEEGPSTLLAWIALGAEHVLLGADHVAFLLGLLLVSRLDRRVIVTVTAFTLAHSITLALSVLDLLRLPPAPVEACIALSVVLVARESLHEEPTLARRAPWSIALLFGLVHGLGFAGALREVGLPERSLGTALLGFNLGIEAGQLALVAVALLLARVVRDARVVPRARTALSYVLGTVGALWAMERVASILGA